MGLCALGLGFGGFLLWAAPAPLDVPRFAPQAPQARMDDWIARAKNASPELQALRAQGEAARLEVQKTESGHLPTLDAVAGWSRSDSDSVTARYEQKTFGLQLNIPLYSGGAVNSQVRQALATQERAREALEGARRELGVRLHQEFRAMTEGVLRIRAPEQAVRSAQQALLSNQKSFQAGGRTPWTCSRPSSKKPRPCATCPRPATASCWPSYACNPWLAMTGRKASSRPMHGLHCERANGGGAVHRPKPPPRSPCACLGGPVEG